MGKRINDPTITEQTSFSPLLRLLVDKMDSDPGDDWLQARNISLKYLGNTYFQGSNNNVNWHDIIAPNDDYIRFSTDGGTNWRDLTTGAVREGSNLYFTEQRVLDITEIDNALTISHSHSNLTALDNIIDNGDGNSFLANNGTYKNLTGSTGTFTTVDGKTVTVTNGIITNII